jgi:aquaporin Z
MIYIMKNQGSRKIMEQASMKKYCAEAFGTCVLTLFGCGSAAIAGKALGTLGIAFAFGLSIVAMAFVIGGVSGCHINPTVSLGLFMDKRLSGKDLIGYWVSQFIGGIVAALLLLLIISQTGLTIGKDIALGTNGYGDASAVGISLVGALIVEIVLTCIFVLIVLGSTANEETAPYAGIIIGLGLTFVHIMGIPLTGTSVNPARSFGPALVAFFQGNSLALSQVWVFIVAPLIGAVLAALLWKYFTSSVARTAES